MTLGEPTESEKQVMQAKSYISDSFDYSHEFQNYGKKHMIFRNIGNLTDHSHQKWAIIMIIMIIMTILNKKFHFEKWISRTNNNYLM